MEKNENTVKCKYCDEEFIPTKPNVSAGDCGQQCPHCGIWTPIPFQIFRNCGGKIPGED